MSNDRRLSAPGRLVSDDPGALGSDDHGELGGVATTDVPSGSLADFAATHGLRPAAERPAIARYLHNLWQRRHFIMAFATARNIAMYTEARLGQLWQVLTPLLNAGVYFLVFGLLLKAFRTTWASWSPASSCSTSRSGLSSPRPR
jgi:teichoic acid transport system permease protein